MDDKCLIRCQNGAVMSVDEYAEKAACANNPYSMDCDPQVAGAFHEGYSDGFQEGVRLMKKNPTDALIMKVLNCIGYEEKSWLEFVRERL